MTDWDELLEQHDRAIAWATRPQPLPQVDLAAEMEQLKLLAEADHMGELRALIGQPPRRPKPDW